MFQAASLGVWDVAFIILGSIKKGELVSYLPESSLRINLHSALIDYAFWLVLQVTSFSSMNHSLEGLVPGEAYMADDDFDDDIDTFNSNHVGSIDFAASIEKVKDVWNFGVEPFI